MIKTLIFYEEEYKAEKIIKTDSAIIGQDLQGNEMFAFRGITDFALFSLGVGEEYDILINEFDFIRIESAQANAELFEMMIMMTGGM